MSYRIVSISFAFFFLCNGCTPNSTDIFTPTTTPRIAPTVLSVLLGEAPHIDGTIEAGEWDGAITEFFDDQSKLFLMRDKEYLYLGIRSSTQEMIAANIFLTANNRISIHHTSAALGTAIYQKDADDWLKTQDFKWRCRATNNSEESVSERDAFLQSEGWLAANSRIGTPNDLEYQIKITEENFSIAVAFMRTSAPDKRVYWPTNLVDSVTQSYPDGLPEKGIFHPDAWGELDLSLQE